MHRLFHFLLTATAAALLPCLSWAAGRLPEPLVRFALADDSLANTGTRTLQSQPTVASGFTFTDVTDANGVTRRALKSTGNAVTNVDLAAEDIKVSGSTVSFWTTTTTANWCDAVGVDFLFDPAESARSWMAWERMNEKNMAVYGVTSCENIFIGDTGKLHHWAMVGEGTHLSFYFDGRFLGRFDKSDRIKENSVLAAFGFGGSATRNAQRGVASTADVRIYGVALTPSQVAFLASGEPIGFCEASLEGEQTLDSLTWDEGEAYEEGKTSVMGLRLAPGATLVLDRALALDRLFLSVPEGTATVKLSGEGTLANIKEIVALGNVDFGSAAIPSLAISAGATATVEARSQITSLQQSGILRLMGGETQNGLSLDDTVAVGQTLAVAKAATTDTLPISGRTLRIEPGADITVNTQFRTADTGSGGDSVVEQTGGTLTCTGPAGTDRKTGAFVLSHWPHTTRYNLSGGTLNVTESSAKLGADGTGHLTLSGTGVANLHSVSLKRGTLKVETGGTLNLGAEAVPSATGVVDFNGGALELAGGTLGPWTRADLTITGAVTVSADSIVRTSPAEGDTERAATVAFTGTLSGAGGLVAQGPGTLDFSAATALCAGGLSIGAGCSAKIGQWRPTINAFGEGATLTLTPTSTEVLDIRLPVADGVTVPKEASLTVSGWDDLETTVENGTLVVQKVTAVPTWTPTDDNAAWGDLTLWKNTEAIPTSGQVTLDYRALTQPKAIAIPAGTVFEAIVLQGSDAAGCALTLTLGEGATLGTLTVAGNVTVPLAAANANIDGISIPAERTLTVDVAEDGTLTAALSGEGAFVKTGTGTLTLNAGVAPLGGTTVAQGCLRFGTATVGGNAYTTASNVTVETGATLDAGGKIDAWLDTVTLKAGATYANSGSEIGTSKRQLRNIVLEGDATVRAEGNFGLIASNHGASRLTLNGHTLTKTGSGAFWLCNTTTSSGTLRVEEGKFQTVNDKTNAFSGPLTFSSNVDGAFDFANGTVPFSGAFTKDGTGAMTFPGVISGDGALNVKAGTLTLTAACTRSASALTTIEAGATLDISATSARLYGTSFGGIQDGITMTVRGRLITRNWAYSENTETGNALGALRSNHYAVKLDGGTVQFIDTNGSGLGSRGFTVTANGATLEIPEGSTLELPKVEHAYANLNGNTLKVCGGGRLNVLQARGPNDNPTDLIGAVTVAEGTALSGTGTIQGTVTLEAGATLDATAGVLTVGALALPEGEGVVTLKAAADAAKGAEVLRFSTPVDVEAFNEDAFTVQGSTLGVVPSSDGSALILTFVATFPDTVGADNGELTDAAAVALLAAAERLGVTEVSAITGRTYGSDLTAAALSGALECFVGEGLVSKGEATAEGTPLTVAYDFGIAAITHNPDGSFTVTVRVQDAAGGDTVAFAPGTTVELYAPDAPEAALVEPKTVEGTPSTVTFEIPATTAAARFNVRPLPFKARVRKE